MRFWNLKALEHDIRKNNLSEKESLIYLLGLILPGFFLLNGLSNQTQTTLWFPVLICLLFTSSIFISFHYNQSADNKDFIKRFLAIWWVLSIKLSVILLAATLPCLFYFKNQIDSSDNSCIYSALAIVYQLLIGTLVVLSFRRIHRHHVLEA